MKAAVVFESRTGNTGLLANTIASALGDSCVLCTALVGEGPTRSIGDADTVFVGFWTDRGTCSPALMDFLETLSGKDVFLFGTAGFGGNQEYFDEVLGKVSAYIPDETRLIGSYMCQGKMPHAVRERYESMLSEMEIDEEIARINAMIDNWDHAACHPDENDLETLSKMVAALL